MSKKKVILRLEMLCGSSEVESSHPGWYDPGIDMLHPAHRFLQQEAPKFGIMVSAEPSLQDGGWYSDCYLYFSPAQIQQVLELIAESGIPGDILDVYEGSLSKQEKEKIEEIACEQDWHFEG